MRAHKGNARARHYAHARAQDALANYAREAYFQAWCNEDYASMAWFEKESYKDEDEASRYYIKAARH